ncbi:uncharacterized protein LOC134815908 [Bolinopsis microptera]|uniref:uncharacterized protein LOC134815908 n=1 Tax=Bolinopsis microptera TaxID=2820187 RepID=UPI0030792C4F
MMKYLVVLAVCIYSASAAIKCVQGTDGAKAASDCAKTDETLCSQPKFTEYTGLAQGVEYACGACAGETKDLTCEECTGKADAGCNTAKTVAADFKCYAYTYNATSKAFDAAAKATTCKRLEATTIVCNKPKSDATLTTYTSTTGCGDCTTKDTACEKCTTDSCNTSGAIRVAALFVPLLAVLINLL